MYPVEMVVILDRKEEIYLSNTLSSMVNDKIF
jgi:hypothetical protein